MVQAFEAEHGDGVPENLDESAHASLLGEVMDFVKDHKAVSTIAAISVAVGSVYLARAPIGRLLGKFGGSVFAANETLAVATLGKTPVGRQLAVAGEDVIVGAAHVEKAVATGVKSEGAVVAGSKATEKTGRPLLDALDDAVKSGKAKSPEPWVYHPENRGVLKDLPKGGSADIKPVGDSVESITQASSTHSSNPNDIVRLAFRGRPNPPLIDVNKHKFLRGK